MANLSGQTDIIADSITLVDGSQLVNIRDIFGAAQSSVPPTPAPTDVLNITGLNQLLDLKRNVADSYDQTTTDTLLNAKRDVSDSYSKQEVYTTQEAGILIGARRLISDSYSKNETDAALQQKRDVSDSYSKQEVYTTQEAGILIGARRLISDSYSKNETDAALQQKRDVSDSYSKQEVYTTQEAGILIGARRLISDSYSKNETDAALQQKRDVSDSYSKQEVYTTQEAGILIGARRLISDSYSKSEIDAALQLKRDVSDSYSQQEVYTTQEAGILIGARRLISDSYSKAEVDSLVAAGGSGLTTAEQTWLTNGQTNLTQGAQGVSEIILDHEGELRARTSSGSLEYCFIPRFGSSDTTTLRYGSGGLNIQNQTSATCLDLNSDLTANFRGDISVSSTTPEFGLRGTSDSDTASLKFSTPGTGQTGYKSIIKALGKTDSGKSQLAFLISNSTSNVNASDNDAVMIVDSMGVQIGNPTVLSTPNSSLDVRGGNIELSDFGSTALQHLKWSAFRTGGRHDIAKIVAQSTSSYGGNLILYYRAPNSNVATGANNVGIHISDTGNVGIGAASSTFKLAVPGSFFATTVSGGTKNFLIEHPTKPDWKLKHGCVETDTGGSCLYQKQLECIQGKNEFQLPEWFSALNENVMVWVNPFKHRGQAWGETIGNVLHVDCSKGGVYNVLIFGQRKDPAALSHWKGAEIPPSEAVEIPE
jgi:hypothetical protein